MSERLSSVGPSVLASGAALLSTRNLELLVGAAESLDVRSFRVDEGLSRPFHVELTAVSSQHDLQLGAVVGEAASFVIRSGRDLSRSEQRWSGICNECRLVRVEEAGLSTYTLSLVPTLWLLTQRRNFRMFQQVSELEAAVTILTEWGIQLRVEVASSFLPREYRVQYGETDFAFVSRMLEDVGVSYYFDQSEGRSVLVLTDAPQHATPRVAPVPFRDVPTVTDRDHVTKLTLSQRVTPGAVTLRDYDTRLPADFPLVSGAGGGSGVEARLEQFEYAPGAFLFSGAKGGDTPSADDRGAARSNMDAAGDLTRRRLEAVRAGKTVITFETTAHDLAPGVVASIGDHPRAELSEPLLVVASSRRGEHDGAWVQVCEARPASTAFRPPLATPRPRVSGVETATVVGPRGEEIHVDELGRVRVHFHWDRLSKRNEQSSSWIHVSQPWGGQGYGGTNLPRVGQEVIVDFLGGDPDRPMVTGRVFTGPQRTPYTLPENKTQSGWKSNSTNQTGGYNELMFEDAAGRELVRMQAERDLDKLVKHDERVVIGHDRSKLVRHDDQLRVEHDRRKRVDNDETVRIGRDRTERVGQDETITVDRDRSELVKKNEDIVIGKNRSKLVKRHEREMVALTRSRLVGINEAVMVGVAQQLRVGKNRNVSIGSNQTTDIGKNHSTGVGKNQSLTVGSNRSIKVGKVASETVGLAKMLTVGAAYQVTVGAAMNTSVALSQSEQVGLEKTVVAGKKISFTCGRTSLIMDAEGKISWSIEGGASIVLDDKNVTVTAPSGGVVVIQGGPEVHLNP